METIPDASANPPTPGAGNSAPTAQPAQSNAAQSAQSPEPRKTGRGIHREGCQCGACKKKANLIAAKQQREAAGIVTRSSERSSRPKSTPQSPQKTASNISSAMGKKVEAMKAQQAAAASAPAAPANPPPAANDPKKTPSNEKGNWFTQWLEAIRNPMGAH